MAPVAVAAAVVLSGSLPVAAAVAAAVEFDIHSSFDHLDSDMLLAAAVESAHYNLRNVAAAQKQQAQSPVLGTPSCCRRVLGHKHDSWGAAGKDLYLVPARASADVAAPRYTAPVQHPGDWREAAAQIDESGKGPVQELGNCFASEAAAVVDAGSQHWVDSAPRTQLLDFLVAAAAVEQIGGSNREVAGHSDRL